MSTHAVAILCAIGCPQTYHSGLVIHSALLKKAVEWGSSSGRGSSGFDSAYQGFFLPKAQLLLPLVQHDCGLSGLQQSGAGDAWDALEEPTPVGQDAEAKQLPEMRPGGKEAVR